MVFNYNTLKVELDDKHRSLKILLNRPKEYNALNREMLFELETIFNWLASHVEVCSVLLSSTSDYFCCGLDSAELKAIDEDKLKKLLLRLQKLVYGSFYLPQTIVCDAKQGCADVGIELTLGADIRVAAKSTRIDFNFLRRGLVPTCGLGGLLPKIIGESFAKRWLMSDKPITGEALLHSGFIGDFYSLENHKLFLEEIISSIAKQPPVARIQIKRTLLESILPELERAIYFEPQFAFAALKSGDWKKIISQTNKDNVTYTSASEMADMLGDHPEQ